MGKMTVAQVQATLGSNPPESHMRAENDFYRTGVVATNALLDAETARVTTDQFANLYQLDAMKVAYYASHSVLTLVSPALLYR